MLRPLFLRLEILVLLDSPSMCIACLILVFRALMPSKKKSYQKTFNRTIHFKVIK